MEGDEAGAEGGVDDEAAYADPVGRAEPRMRSLYALIQQVDKHIEDLRDYLRTRLRQNRLSTDYRDGFRVKQYNAKVKPEPIPEHNDPYRIDWTEVDGRKFFVGTEVSLRTPGDSLREGVAPA
jgi:hypothetical protein